MCPFDASMQKAMGYFELFLPTTLPPELHDKGFKWALSEPYYDTFWVLAQSVLLVFLLDMKSCIEKIHLAHTIIQKLGVSKALMYSEAII